MPPVIRIKFGKHLPDQPRFGNPGTSMALNVVPSAGFLRPFAGLAAFSSALSGRAIGAVSGRDSTGNVYTFAGDATKLYKLTGQTFTDVSRISGGPYATSPTGQWEFIPWSDNILIAVNGVDAPQAINPLTGSNFTALSGLPPAAAHGAIVRSFVLLGNWSGNENGAAWSAIDNAEEWNTNGVNQSDQEFFASGGPVMRIFGGEVGLVFCQSSIYRMTYVGSPVIFQKDEIAPGIGLLASGGAAQWGNMIMFLGQNSFYRIDGAGGPVAIGESRFNKTFFSDVDDAFLNLISSAIDPINTIWMMIYKSVNSASAVPDRAFLYNWTTDDCSFVDIRCEYVIPAYTTGITLDDLQTQTGFNLDTLPFSLDSRIWQGGQLILGAFDDSHRLSFLSGPKLEAVIETGEQDNDGARLFVSGVRPLCDAENAEISMIMREFQGSQPLAGPFTQIGPDGFCPQHAEGRYMSARLRIPAGSSWSKVQGVDVAASQGGDL